MSESERNKLVEEIQAKSTRSTIEMSRFAFKDFDEEQ